LGDRPLAPAQDAGVRRGLIGTAAFCGLPVSTPQYHFGRGSGIISQVIVWLGSALAAIIASACGLF
jgi:hypothetical protein